MRANKEQFEELCRLYEVTLDEGCISFITEMVSNFIHHMKEPYSDRLLEVAEMLYHIRGLAGSIEIKGIVEKSRECEIKGIERKRELNISSFQDDLEGMLNYILKKEFGDIIYIFILKHSVDEWEGLFKKDFFNSSDFLLKQYTEMELQSILDYCRQIKDDEENYTIAARLGVLCHRIDYSIPLNSYKSEPTKTKKYSFIYDIIHLTGYNEDKGKGFTGYIGKEKADWIKNKMTSYDSQLKKVGK